MPGPIVAGSRNFNASQSHHCNKRPHCFLAADRRWDNSCCGLGYSAHDHFPLSDVSHRESSSRFVFLSQAEWRTSNVFIPCHRRTVHNRLAVHESKSSMAHRIGCVRAVGVFSRVFCHSMDGCHTVVDGTDGGGCRRGRVGNSPRILLGMVTSERDFFQC